MVAEFETDPIENRLWLDDQARLALSTPVRGRGSRPLGRRVVVIGAGIGGLRKRESSRPPFSAPRSPIRSFIAR
jgi:hypothetical protein